MSKEKKLWIIPLAILAVLVLAAGIAAGVFAQKWQQNEFSLDLTIHGDEEVTVEVGGSYEDEGASATFRGTVFLTEPVDVEVMSEGAVDTATVGTYHIDYATKYTAKVYFLEVTMTDYDRRTVHVVDTEAPVITLVADPDTYTIPGQIYQEEGYTATDNYDGDITDRVVRTETTEFVTYQVTDSSGNTVEIQREIVYFDPIAPELTLKGKASMTLELGSKFTEPGYTATDNCDGDITGWVKVSGTVNTAKVGTYTIEYTVKDSYDNAATAKRTVKVIEPETEPTTKPTVKPTNPSTPKPTDPKPTEPKPGDGKVDPANPVGGTIYLTFDDGPGRHTGRLLDILAKYKVKATFFVVNTGYYSTLTRMANEGHTVAIHSATHNFSQIYASEEAYFADLEKMQSIITTHTGKKPMLLRFPGGSSNTVSRKYNEGIMTRLTKLVEEKGYTYFDWNVDSNDAGGTSTATGVYNNVVKGCAKRKSSVVLMHDIKGYTVDAVEDIIMWGLNNGYTFKALTSSSPTCHHSVNN